LRETDEQLFVRFLEEGNSDDLRVLLDRYRESLTLFLYGYVHNMEDAEDIMMSAFAVAASGASVFSGRSSFKTWLYGIGRNLAMHHLRSLRRTDPLGHEVEAGSDSTADMRMLEDEEKRQLYTALEELPDDYRNALYLVYFENMDHDEAARIMKKSKKQIYNLVFRGKQSLKDILERMGYVRETDG